MKSKIIFILCLALVLISMAGVNASEDIAVQTGDNTSDCIIALGEVDGPYMGASDDENNVFNDSFKSLQGLIGAADEEAAVYSYGDYYLAEGESTVEVSKNVNMNGNDPVLENVIFANVTADNGVYGTPVTITLKTDYDGSYEVSINDLVVEMEAVDGICVREVMLNAGSYQTSTICHDDVILNCSEASFVVDMFEVELNLEMEDEFAYPSDITGVITSNAAGEYQLRVNDFTQNVSINGSYGFSLGEYEVGNYTLIVMTMLDGNYSKKAFSYKFEVIKGNATVLLFISNSSVSDEIEAFAYASVDGTYTIKVGDLEKMMDVVDNVGEVNLGHMDIGVYNATIEFGGNGNYNSASNSTTFTVSESGNVFELNVSNPEVVYGDDVLVTPILPSDATGWVVYCLNNEQYVNLSSDESLKLSGLDAGSYLIVASYSGDSNYNSSEDVVKIIVNKAVDNAVVSVENVTFGMPSVIVVDADIDGDYSVNINGSVAAVTVLDGRGNASVYLDAGNYSINITFDCNNYDLNSSDVTFEVCKAVNNVLVSVEDAVYGQASVINVMADADGNYSVNINGEDIIVNVLKGKGNASLYLDRGSYSTVTSFDDANYASNITESVFAVSKADATLNIIVDSNYTHVVLTAIVTNGTTGFVRFVIKGNNYYAPIEEGKAVLVFDLLAGRYWGNVYYDGDDNFNPAFALLYFEVTEEEVILENTSIEVVVDAFENNVTITVAVNESATGFVEFIIDGNGYYALIENGQAVYNIVLAGGDYNVSATYLGDDKFNPNSTAKEFKVQDHIKVNTTLGCDVSVENFTVTITVNVEQNATGNVIVTVAGTDYVGQIKDGKAVIISDFFPGSYVANITYGGDINFNSASNATSFTIIEQKPDLRNTPIDVVVGAFENDVTIVARVNARATGLVEFNIDGKVVYVAVNNGKAEYDVVLPGGDYSVAVTYLGDSRFNANRTSKSFTVTDHIKMNTTITSNVVVYGYNVTLTVNVDEGAAGFVKFTLEGNDIFTEVKNGKAYLAISLLPGDYTITATYLGDDDFNANTTDIYFAVDESLLENTTIDVLVFAIENDVYVWAYVNESATGFFEFIVGDYVDYIPVVNGQAIESLVLPGGDYNVSVTYMGDSKFNPNSTVEEFTVSDYVKSNATVICDVSIDGNTVAITANVERDGSGFVGLDPTGFVEFIIRGMRYYVPVEEGKAVLVSDFLAGTYSGNVNYLGDDYYNPADTTVHFTVIDGVITRNDTSIDVTIDASGNDMTIIAIVNESATGLVEFIIGDNATYIPVTNGRAVYDVNLASGDYNVSVTYLGDAKFNPNSTAEEFTVHDYEKLNTSINCEVLKDGYTVKIIADIESDVTGLVEFNIAGKCYYVPVEDGKAVFVSDFLPGIYSANVTYLGDGRFNPADMLVSFSVSKHNISLDNTTIDVLVGGFENDVIITAFVNESATGLVEFIIEDKVVYIAVNNGQAVYDAVLPGGEYNISVTYLGDSKFNPNSTSRDFIVQDHMKMNTSIDANVSIDGYYVTLTAAVNECATGFVEFTLGENSIFAEVNGGVAIVNAVLLPGEYAVTATYLGDYDFSSNSTGIDFRVDEIPKNETDIGASVDIDENNVVITVIINENATGFVEFDFSGEECFKYYAPAYGGKAIYDGVLAAGSYDVQMTYLGDENFNANTVTERFAVTGHIKENTTIGCDVAVDENDVTLTVNLKSDATGLVGFDIVGMKYYAPVNGGKAVLMYFLPAGNYTVVVSYAGDENYNSANATVDICVLEIEPEDAGFTVTAVNSTITVKVNEEATGCVLVDVDGTGYYATIKEGQATVNVIGLDGGEYEATVTYSGDAVFAAANATVNVTVMPSGKNDTPVDPEADISISAEGVAVILPEDATGYVLIDVDGTGYYTTVENGKAKFELPELAQGNHTVTVTYTGDKKYASANATGTVTIDIPIETIISDNLTKIEKAPDRFEAVFTDAEGNLLANAEVTFEIKGNVYKRNTDANGKAGMNINLEPGVYAVKITNTVTGEVKFNTITVKSRFEDAHDLVKYYRNDSQYRIKVLGDDGNIAPKGTVVKFNINGVFYERSVDEKGYVKMNINLNPGTYVITAEYKGCRVSNTITVLPILTASDLTKRYGENNPFEAKLVDAQGRPYANQKLEFNINGVFYYRTTNSNGIAKLNINLMPKAYVITTTYGDAAISNNVIITA